MSANNPLPTPTKVSPKWQRGSNLLLAILFLGVAGFLIVMIAQATGNKELTSQATTAKDIGIVLAPFLAIALAVERFWEALFDWYESFALATARLVGIGAQTGSWVKTELANAEQAVSQAAQALGATSLTDTDKYTKAWEQFQDAESRMKDAQSRITEALTTPEYKAIKRAVTLFGSLLIGLILSVTSRLTLFAAAGFSIPVPVDMLMTGLLIGSGSGPMHSFIGTLQEFRNTLGNLSALAQGSAIKQATDAIQQSSVDTRTLTTSNARLVILNTDRDEKIETTSMPDAQSSLTTMREAKRLLRAR